MFFEAVRRLTPVWIKQAVPPRLKDRLRPREQSLPLPSPSEPYLRDLLGRYQTKDLVNEDPQAFRKRIEQFLEICDHRMEGFDHPEKQRDLSVRFHWGHDHDFGDFFLKGSLGDSHIRLIATFLDRLDELPRCLENKRVLDIGCWTGSTSLLLCAMGAEVVAVDEVRKYVDCLSYLKHAFGLDRLHPKNLSLYECTTSEFQDAFDLVLFAGVLYHVTDPILALRITFNCLKDGGKCLVETAVDETSERILAYEGPSVVRGGSVEDASRTGWNWLIPSLPTLTQMMADVGYSRVVGCHQPVHRAYAVGTRQAHQDLMRGGLSVRTIR